MVSTTRFMRTVVVVLCFLASLMLFQSHAIFQTTARRFKTLNPQFEAPSSVPEHEHYDSGMEAQEISTPKAGKKQLSDLEGPSLKESTWLSPLPEIDVPAGLERILREAQHLKRCYGTKEPPENYRTLVNKTGCDVFSVPFNPALDARCIAYLSNTANWEDVSPITQRFDERTIKFKVKYKDGMLKAMMKVPQRLFPFETFHETAAFAADRLMGINRVPPTLFLSIPLDIIREAAAKGEKMALVGTFAKESNVMNYSAWLTKDFFNFIPKKDSVFVSLQLFMVNVNRLLSSCLRVPYSQKSNAWYQWFEPRSFLFHNNSNHTVTLTRLSEVAVYDYILGNSDRTPNKNNFVAGGCDSSHCKRKEAIARPGPPSFLTLDNGMTFYGHGGHTKTNPLHAKNTTMCYFREPLIRRLSDLNTTFMMRLTKMLHPKVVKVIGAYQFEECQRRLRRVLRIVKACLELWNASLVFAP